MANTWLAALTECERVALSRCIKNTRRSYARCARLGIPTFEWVKVLGKRRTWVSVGNALCEVIAGDSLAIMAFKVKRHALGKTFSAGERLHHAHHFGTFFINRDGIEVVDFYIAVRPHRMRHRTCVFRKLHGAQQAHVFDAFDSLGRSRCNGVIFKRLRCEVLAELLVAENGQAFFKRELEPVTASDAVACPVMEIFVADDAFDIGVIVIGCGGRIG